MLIAKLIVYSIHAQSLRIAEKIACNTNLPIHEYGSQESKIQITTPVLRKSEIK